MSRLGDPVYADTSALVKLVVPEPESDALLSHLRDTDHQLASSVICEVELLRAVARADPDRLDRAQLLLEQLILLPLTSAIRRRAAAIKPPSTRSLDAIHLATALEIQADLHSMLSYDNRLTEGSKSVGIETFSPGT